MNLGEGKRSALVVAVWKYRDEAFAQLRAPSRDAEELARVLRDPEVGAYDVQTSLNERSHRVRRKLNAFLAGRRRDDSLLLHISCHGVKDEHGELYFAAADTELALLKSTSIESSFLSELMSESRAGRIAVFLDCCFSGAFTDEFVPRGGNNVDVLGHLAGAGRAVITASGKTEYAFEGVTLAGEDPRPSVFTTALVRGLDTGDADRDRDGLVSFDDLYDYVHDSVVKSTTGQTPMKSVATMQGRLVIATSRRPAELEPELVAATTSPLEAVRAAAAGELAVVAAGPHPGYAAAARSALERLALDGRVRVQEAAQAALRGELAHPPPGSASPSTEPGRQAQVRRRARGFWERAKRHPRLAGGTAAAAALTPLLLGIALFLRGGEAAIEWTRAQAGSFGGPGIQVSNAAAVSGDPTARAFVVGYDRPGATAQRVVWSLARDGWRRERLPRTGALNAVAAAGRLTVAAGRSGPEGPGQGAAVWLRQDSTWSSACGTACGDVATARFGAGPRQQEVFGVAALREFPGQFVAVGADQNTATDGKYDGAVWLLEDRQTAHRVALDELSLGGPLQQQLRAVADTQQGLIAVGQDGPHAGVWRSTDKGSSWLPLVHDALRAGVRETRIAFGVVEHGSDVVVVGAQGDESGNENRAAAWVLHGASATWERATSSDFEPRGQAMLAVTATTGGLLVAVGYDHNETERRAAVWTSEDGVTWKRRGGAPDEPDSAMNDVVTLGEQLVAVGSAAGEDGVDARIWTADPPG